MRLATEPTSVKFPASVAAIATTSQARCGSCKFGTNDLRRSTAGTLLTRLDSTAVTPARIVGLSRCWWAIAALTIGPDHRFLEPTDDDKQPDEHHKKRPVDLDINLFRSHAPREQQKSTAHNGHLGDWLAEEEQHYHNRHNK